MDYYVNSEDYSRESETGSVDRRSSSNVHLGSQSRTLSTRKSISSSVSGSRGLSILKKGRRSSKKPAEPTIMENKEEDDTLANGRIPSSEESARYASKLSPQSMYALMKGYEIKMYDLYTSLYPDFDEKRSDSPERFGKRLVKMRLQKSPFDALPEPQILLISGKFNTVMKLIDHALAQKEITHLSTGCFDFQADPQYIAAAWLRSWQNEFVWESGEKHDSTSILNEFL